MKLSEQSSKSLETEPDLLICQNEAIHLLGKIQNHGFLLAVDQQGLIRYASKNIEAYTKYKASSLLGKSLQDLLGIASASLLISHFDKSKPESELFTLPLLEDKEHSIHCHINSQNLLIIECEIHDSDIQSQHHEGVSWELLTNLNKTSDLQQLLSCFVEHLRSLSGFDRVLIYRFDNDWNGQVEAESRADFMESYLGLHFPASDIPSQARALYKLNPIRILPDRQAEESELLSTEAGETLDLTHSLLRSMSRVHIEYLENMQVKSSMSVSVLIDDELWALIACHSREAKHLHPDRRKSILELSRILALMVRNLQQKEAISYSNELYRLQNEFWSETESQEDLIQKLRISQKHILQICGADAFCFKRGEVLETFGELPEKRLLEDLLNWLPTKLQSTGHIASNSLSKIYPEAASISDRASGLLAVSLNERGDDYLLWLRKEIVQEVRWAGDPNKPVSNDNMRIHPRRSFEIWKDNLYGYSVRWHEAEIESALRFRNDMLNKLLSRLDNLRMIEQEAETARANLHKERDGVLAALAHELQTPCISAGRLLDFLRNKLDGQIADEELQILDLLYESNSRQLERIKDLLSIFKYKKQVINLNFQVHKLVELVNECCLDMQAAARAHNVMLRPDLRLQDATVKIDAPSFKRLLCNLLDNAIKFSPEGETVDIVLDRYESSLKIEVKDKGRGIASQDIETLFSNFWTGGSQTRYPSNIGMGLYLSMQIADSLDITLSCKSLLGEGSTFSLEIPELKI